MPDLTGHPLTAGPAELTPWPSALTAHVVTPGPRPHLHGYDVEGDLALRYRPTDVQLLALTGELPSEEVSAAFAVVSMFLAPISVAEAPAHAAVVARLCGAAPSALLGVTAIALAEQARVLVGDHAELLRWLDAGAHDAIPHAFVAQTEDDVGALDRLVAALAPTGFAITTLRHRPNRTAALLCVLHACGLTRPEALSAVLVNARLLVALAEGMANQVADFKNYPTDLPAYRYHEGT